MAAVTIVGAGNMARGIGTRFVSAGVDLQILAPKAEAATALAEQLGGAGSASGGDLRDPPNGEVVVLATPYEAALDYAAQHAAELAGKIVVDITNPVDWTNFDRLVAPADSSGAQAISAQAPEAHVVKAFNTTFAATLIDGEVAGQPLDVLLAGDDAAAKARLASLIEAAGLRPIDAGPLSRAQQLEHLGLLHMALQERLGSGYGSAVKVVSP